MDLRTPSSGVTSIGRGVPTERKFVGMYYVADNGKAHVTQMESCIQTEAPRTAVIEENGQLLSVATTPEGRDQEVELCERCAPLEQLDHSWHEEAACYNTQVDGFFERAGAAKAIEQYCDNCPVARECLESGALLDKQNAGTVWGGVYFVKNRHERLKHIEAKRKELSAK